MENLSCIRRGQSVATAARTAARQFYAAVVQPDMALVIFFCSPEYDLDELASELKTLFSGVQVVGCTTAGEIGLAGYLDRSITGASFGVDSFTAASGLLSDLKQFTFASARSLGQELLQGLETTQPGVNVSNTFALLLIDGLSRREEPVAAALQSALGEIPLIGGSAGQGLRFERTRVYADGCFHDDSAVVTLVTTPLAFTTFKAQHFVPTDRRVVVTEADPERRVVQELDGFPAAAFYAELVGSSESALDAARFAAEPVVVLIDGTNYVRSIQKANPDGTLTFYSAIDEGLVLRTARGVDLVQNLEEAFDAVRATIGPPQLVIACDCILRRLEIIQRELVGRVDALFRDNNVVGFNSYGEQYHGVHVNQTLTGIAIGEAVR